METKLINVKGLKPWRKREVSIATVADLKKSIKRVGYLCVPILVVKRIGGLLVIDGWHRVLALRGLKRKQVFANIVNWTDEQIERHCIMSSSVRSLRA